MSKPMVMVVDDEADVANSIANTIKDSGKYEVIVANSGQEALDNLKKHKVMFGLGGNHIRLILLDIKMPQMSGLEVLEKIRQDFGEDIGISMLTAWEDEEKWERATSGFVVNYIKKPFKSEELIATIDDFFAGKEGMMVLDTFEKHISKREKFEQEKREKAQAGDISA